jgi:2-hydroxychromene-2-carboxylate isomerase
MEMYIDFKSAPAYLAMKPTLALLERRELQATWWPFDTRQSAVPPERADESRGEAHVRVRQLQRQRTCLKYAAIQGIPMRYPENPGESRCALAALLHVRDAPLPFIAAAFRAYWQDNRNLDDPRVVAGLLASVGCDPDRFSPAEYEEALTSRQLEAEAAGVFDTPMYVVGGELFLGREQLPWIESIAS